MELKDWLSIFIPAGVTIIGLVVNFAATKSSIKNEISKQQGSIKLDKLLQCLEDYQETYRAILNSSKLGEKEKSSVINRQVIALQRIMDYVYLYGSESACKIASSWQQYGFAHAQDKKQTIIPVCYANILIAQICLDVTGNCNRPSYYYKIKLSDYINLKDTIRKEHNHIVEELDLDNRLEF